MADEILWRAGLHPSAAAGTLDDEQARHLWEQVRWVSRTAIRIISDDWTYPKSWLFAHRWEAGGQCPRCRTDLERATIGGRTTCWCPECQPKQAVRCTRGRHDLKSRWLNATAPITRNVTSSVRQICHVDAQVPPGDVVNENLAPSPDVRCDEIRFDALEVRKTMKDEVEQNHRQGDDGGGGRLHVEA